MLSSPPELKVLERCQVSPPPGAVAESTLPLTFFDIGWLYAESVERVFFYAFPVSTSHFMDSVVPSLKSSLSLTLQHFYPLAGKIRRTPGSVDKYEIRYADGDSVSVTLAEHDDDDFDDISGSHPRELIRLHPLVPQLPQPDDDNQGMRLLALQVTVFPGRGIAVGVAVRHVACDGSSSVRFLSSWASACPRPGRLGPAPPVLDRSLISDPKGLYSIFFKSLVANGQVTKPLMNQAVAPGAVIGSFTLKGDHIRRLKELASATAKAKAEAEEGGASLRFSTIVVTYAYAWVCLVKTRAYADDRIAHLGFAADCRARLRPPLPAAYFGNCLLGCFVEMKAGELTGEDGVSAAAMAISKAVQRFIDGPLEGADEVPEKYKAVASEQVFSVAGSPKLGVYEVDFGWGKPKKVEIISIARTGAMSVAESREEEGGVEIGLVLPKLDMDKLKAHFSSGLKLLE
ncbi:hypothetical protein B296_00047816 [Ensete ventricosum]|uniref:Uncharacterized protein n=1 Tax=Ensete ventricosum TaxID=4639 RepID=A0A426XCN3_ENSVE|nr:hypothetical protein B296_00047816 [Ensete ventricosum]